MTASAKTPSTLAGRAFHTATLVLLGEGIVCAVIAATLRPGHELGLLALGVGLLLAFVADRDHYLIPGAIVTPVALVNVLWLYGIVPGNDVEGFHLLAVGGAVALLMFAARGHVIGRNPISAGLWTALIGVLILGLSLKAPAATTFYRFFESLWMPAVVLGAAALSRLAWRNLPPQPPSRHGNAAVSRP
ncbi:MAG: hypothetical protein ACRDHE_07275 [Ktedonobacterales bacterium]